MIEPVLTAGIASLLVFSLIILRSIAVNLFPLYFLYIILGILAYIILSRIDFDIWVYFYKYFYLFSIIFLLITLIIGQVTRGTIRWLQIGPFTLQSAEIVRPFLLIFFASFISRITNIKKSLIYLVLLILLPLILVLIQPSLGVTILISAGILGVLLASKIDKKILIYFFVVLLLLIPLAWNFLIPYQKGRITSFFTIGNDALGVGYQSLQSTIAVGSGKLNGRGLGEGVQTQLAFLPEKQTDFVFAAISEEMGLIGAGLVLIIWAIILYRLTTIYDRIDNLVAKSYVAGVLLMLILQIFVHVGMNMGILPITGIPLPLISAGGSSLVSTMAILGLVVAAGKNK